MDFREATNGLFDRVDHEALAKALGVSVASIRQARLRPEAGAYRSPPNGWQRAVVKLAKDCAERYQRLAEALTLEDRGEGNQEDSYLQAKRLEKSVA